MFIEEYTYTLIKSVLLKNNQSYPRGNGTSRTVITLRNDPIFPFEFQFSVRSKSHRTIGFQFEISPLRILVHPRRFIRRFFPPLSLRTILEHTSLARREDTVRMRAAVKDGRFVELLRMACSSFLSSQQKQPLPSVCLFPAGIMLR